MLIYYWVGRLLFAARHRWGYRVQDGRRMTDNGLGDSAQDIAVPFARFGEDNLMKRYRWLNATAGVLIILAAFIMGGCGTTYPPLPPGQAGTGDTPLYLIGPGDSVGIFVWRNPELSQSVPVRPDGKITTPLVEDLQAAGKTPTELARDMEKVLATYIRDPIVTVIVTGFVGPYTQQIRVVGEATQPQALAYREDMSLLDVMIAVGGLTNFAAGNKATVVRVVEGKQQQFGVRIEDLIRDGDIGANVQMLPGDILIIPEAFF